MGAKFRSLSSVAYNYTTGPMAVPVPAGVVNGDLLIVVLGSMGTAAPATVPGGWTLLDSQVDPGGGNTSFVYARIAASEPASYNFGWTGVGSVWQGAAMVAYYDAKAIPSVIGKDAGALGWNGSAYTITAPSVTSVADGDLWLAIFHQNYNGGTPSWSTPAGFTARSTTAPVGIFEKQLASTGATGTAQSVCAASGKPIAFSVLIPAIPVNAKRPIIGGL